MGSATSVPRPGVAESAPEEGWAPHGIGYCRARALARIPAAGWGWVWSVVGSRRARRGRCRRDRRNRCRGRTVAVVILIAAISPI